MKSHKHAALIKQWADGAEIEFFNSTTQKWLPCPVPSWEEDLTYRIKPQKLDRFIPVMRMPAGSIWLGEGRISEEAARQTNQKTAFDTIISVVHLSVHPETEEVELVKVIK